MKSLTLILSLLAFPAFAQSQQQSPSQIAIQITTIVGQWAQTIETQQRMITEGQQEIARLKAELEKKEKPDAK